MGSATSHGLPGSGQKISSAALCRRGRPGPCNAHAAQRAAAEPHRARVHLFRASRHWQDHHRAHSGHGAELPDGSGHGPATDAGTVRHMRRLHGDSPGQRRGCDRNRCGHQPRHRRDSRAARCGALRPVTRPLQNLHPRRSAPDYRGRLQRAAQDAGGTAGARHLHDGDHRAREHSPDHSLALPALQLSCGQIRRHPGAVTDDCDRRACESRRRCAGAPGRGRRRIDARRALHHGPGDRVRPS